MIITEAKAVKIPFGSDLDGLRNSPDKDEPAKIPDTDGKMGRSVNKKIGQIKESAEPARTIKVTL